MHSGRRENEASASDPDQQPEQVGAYRILKLLGRGGMGEVFLAYDDRLKRHVAIKRVRLDRTKPDDRRRFQREARAAARLSHPAVVQIHDILEEESCDYIVMEYAEGATLAQLVRQGPLQIPRALAVAIEVAKGLEQAHARGLVHRDLKAENVIVTGRGQAKILDFGLAKPIWEQEEAEPALTEHGTVLGTSRAMSPEQAGGEEVDHRSDLFSLGVLLYEMLTGASPFEAESPLKTLNRVLTVDPQPVSALRPEVGKELSDLVDWMLQKEPLKRPRDVRQVRTELERIGRQLNLTEAHPGFSGLQTGTYPTIESPAQTEGIAGRPARWASWPTAGTTLLAAAAVIALGLAGLALYLNRTAVAPQPLRVAVLKPLLTGSQADQQELRLVSSAVAAASLETLTSLQGIAALDPSETADAGSTAVEAARALAVDEVVSVSIEGQGELCRIDMRRVRGEDGAVVWTQSFPAPADPGETYTIAEAVQVHLREAYSGHPLRAGFPELKARPEDYSAYLKISLEVEKGEQPLEPLLDQLSAILQTSPRLLGAYHLAADVATSLFSRTRDRSYYQRGMDFVEQASQLAPSDLRHKMNRVLLLLEDNRTEEAQAVLAELQARLPGEPRILTLRADVEARLGRNQQAISIMREVARQNPAWQSLYRLANLEYRVGEVDEARRHLKQLLERAPDNRWGLSKLGQIELLYGDLKEAEAIYLDLSQSAASRSFLTNLGLSRFLQGDYQQAVDAYQKALKIAPRHKAVMLNLADAQAAQGNQREARSLCRDLLGDLAVQEQNAPLDPRDRMIQAQCLTRLGRSREAVEIVQETLAEDAKDSEVFYIASLIYALAGDRTSALVNAEKAIARGVQARWFEIPGRLPSL